MRKLRNDNKVKVCTPFSPRYDMRWSKKKYANFYDAKIALKFILIVYFLKFIQKIKTFKVWIL